jgi:hypothetical protein
MGKIDFKIILLVATFGIVKYQQNQTFFYNFKYSTYTLKL